MGNASNGLHKLERTQQNDNRITYRLLCIWKGMKFNSEACDCNFSCDFPKKVAMDHTPYS